MVKQLCESAGVAVERRFPSGKWTAIERRSEQFRFVWFPQFEYVQAEPAEQVRRLARLTHECGLPGVVCSALEIPLVQSECGRDFVLVVPGIRPAGAAKGDQKRVMTPHEAAQAGAQFIVVGRPIIAAPDPAAAAAAVQEEIRLA